MQEFKSIKNSKHRNAFELDCIETVVSLYYLICSFLSGLVCAFFFIIMSRLLAVTIARLLMADCLVLLLEPLGGEPSAEVGEDGEDDEDLDEDFEDSW